jgi:hypothetical protein
MRDLEDKNRDLSNRLDTFESEKRRKEEDQRREELWDAIEPLIEPTIEFVIRSDYWIKDSAHSLGKKGIDKYKNYMASRNENSSRYEKK